jgi:hypothetical protein
MVQFLPCPEQGEFMLPVDQLLTLADAGFEDAPQAMRRMIINKEYVAELVVSNPREWPAALVTLTDRGYVLVDGRHRREAVIDKGMEELRVTCRQFANEQEVIETAFEENLRHGLRLSLENRSDYVYVLHKHHPKMTQKELAARAHVSQSTVSEAIARRTQREQAAIASSAPAGGEQRQESPSPDLELAGLEEEHLPPAGPTPQVTEEDRLRREMQKTTKSMAREASRVLSFIQPLDETERRRLLIEWLAPESVQEREALLRFAHLIEEVLEPQPRHRPPKRGH